MNVDIEKVVQDAFDNIVKEAAKNVIVTQLGCGIDTEVKQVLRQKAMDMLNTDEEIKKLLKERLIHWITNQ
jgi:uncharacterized UPF0146 family protein